MGKNNNNQPWQDIKRRMENAKAVTQKPGGNLAGAVRVQMPKLPKTPAVQSYANGKSANLFYANPYNGGTMLTGVKPTITAPPIGTSLSGGANSYRAAYGVKPVAAANTPASLVQYQKAIEEKKKEIDLLNRQQYGAMLKGENTNQHDMLRIKHDAELKQLQTAYAQAMGIGFKKPKNQLLPDAQSAKDEADFWAGFRKGLGLKDGEEIGGGTGDIGFAAQDVMAHRPGMGDEDYPSPEPDFPKEWPQEEEPEEDSDVVHDIIGEFKEFLKEHEWSPEGNPKEEEASLQYLNEEENHDGKEKANESLISTYRANKAKVESAVELDAVQDHQYFWKYFEGSPSDYEYESYEVYQGVKVVSFTRMEKNEHAGSTYVSNRTAYILIGSRKDILEYADSFELNWIPDGLKALGGAGKIIGEGLKELYPLLNNMSIISEVSPLFAAAGMVLDSYQQQGEIIGDELKKYSGEELIIPIGAEFSGGSGSHGGAWYMNINGVIMGTAR